MLVLGDGISREHKFQECAHNELAKIQLLGVMIPLGNKKVVINRDNGQTVERPYIWAISIRKSSDPQLLAQVIPALNASVKLQIEVPYRAVAAPTAHKTEEEITVITAKGIHRQLWNHRRPKTTLKKDREQAWADDFTTIIAIGPMYVAGASNLTRACVALSLPAPSVETPTTLAGATQTTRCTRTSQTTSSAYRPANPSRWLPRMLVPPKALLRMTASYPEP